MFFVCVEEKRQARSVSIFYNLVVATKFLRKGTKTDDAGGTFEQLSEGTCSFASRAEGSSIYQNIQADAMVDF